MSDGRAPVGETVTCGTVSEPVTGDEGRSRPARMPVDQIRPRPHGDTRPLDLEHVQALAESIQAVGLLNPITVDDAGHLIAGAHRLAAVRLLRERGQWEGPVPVNLHPVDVTANAKLALEIEVSENDKRRDYTVAEIREVARRLKAAGYRAVDGRPRRGEKPILPALMVIVGKSKRHLIRALGEKPGGTPASPALATAEATLRVGTVPARDEVRELGQPGGLVLNELAMQAAALGEVLDRAAVLPLDEWSAVAPDRIQELAGQLDDVAEALVNVAAVARSAISMTVEDSAVAEDGACSDVVSVRR